MLKSWLHSPQTSFLLPAVQTLGPLLQVTRTVPIVFVQVTDPVGAGYVQSLARPGGNATGFIPFEFGTSGKWLELLNEIAPGIRRVAVLRDAALVMGIGQLGAIQSVSPSFGVELRPVGVADANEIERGIAAFAREPYGAMIVTVSPATLRHREMIIALAARYRLPAVYPYSFFSTEGGLVSVRTATPSSLTDAPLAMWTEYLEARSRPTCRCRHPPNTT